MKVIRIAAASLNQTPLDWAGNRRRIVEAIRMAREQKAHFLLLPELCITGYGCEDAFASQDLLARAREILFALAGEAPEMIVIAGLPVLVRKAVFNAAAVLAGGAVRGLVAKQHLAGDGLHYEPRWFRPWKAGARDLWEKGIPVGDLLFEAGGIRFGLEICEDAWVADRPGARLARRGADILFNPSASHFALEKHRIRRNFVANGSRAFGCAYVYANLMGNEAGRAIYDGGNLIAFSGEVVAAGPRLGFEEVLLTSADADIDLLRNRQVRIASFTPELGAADDCLAVDMDFAELAGPQEAAPAPAPWEAGPDIREQEFTRAMALGLFDYLRKSRAKGFVLSLSGGADSTACALLVESMVRLGAEQVGLVELARRLDVEGMGPESRVRDLVGKILVCMYQRTRNSSAQSRESARAVAEALGARFLDLDIDPIAAGYTRMMEEALGRKLGWERDDIGLQNIQARTRAPGPWLAANIFNMLLLATSNRSEAAVGYATMDGDTCGSLAPIAGIDKAFLLRWLAWMRTEGAQKPYPVLGRVLAQAPSAELRPPEAMQNDEEDLMPYEVLNAIELAAIRDKQGPEAVWRIMRTRFPQYGGEKIGEWTEKFFRLWSRNQWKRERYAPSFHLDDENLDPRSWCRFPILSGGFETELAELAELVFAEEAAKTRKEVLP